MFKHLCLNNNPCFLFRIDAWYQQELSQATNTMESTVQFLLMELENVGNIRLEEGCFTDPWYVFSEYNNPIFFHYTVFPKLIFFCYLHDRFTSCCDLLHSRFCHSDYKIHGITGIKIDRVIRIQNTALRLRFEDKLHSLIASDSHLISK